MKLSTSLMAHPDREHYIPYLKERLGDVPVAFENGGGIWDTCRRAWLLYDKESTHHAVIQDDAIVCDDFYNRAEQILEEHQDEAVIFYAGETTTAYAKVYKKEKGFYTSKIFNEVAICLPTQYVEPMVEWADRMKADNDKLISRYCRRHKIKIYNPMPSLIDHRSDISIFRSVYNKPQPDDERHALWFIDNPKPPCLQ